MKALLTPKRLLQALLIVIGIIGITIAVRQNPTAREVVRDAFAGLFGFFTTPFILEASIAIGGLIAVVTYNQWRINREGDGWVTLSDSEPPLPTPPHSAPTPPSPDTNHSLQ
jgi:hypothetical protein